jgi:hypothetical protein
MENYCFYDQFVAIATNREMEL